VSGATDLRTSIARELRVHPRVAYQGLFGEEDAAAILAADLPPMPPFREEFHGAIAVVDWDHRLPSQALALRVYGFYDQEAMDAGQEAYDDRLEEIGARDKFPEFDVPDFDNIPAHEAYEIELSPDGQIGRCRLTSAWRRNIDPDDGAQAVDITNASSDFATLKETVQRRPARLGELEAVSWTPPCESNHNRWTLDVWYLLAFDGRVGTGRSFLVDLDDEVVVTSRDFSVRTA